MCFYKPLHLYSAHASQTASTPSSPSAPSCVFYSLVDDILPATMLTPRSSLDKKRPSVELPTYNHSAQSSNLKEQFDDYKEKYMSQESIVSSSDEKSFKLKVSTLIKDSNVFYSDEKFELPSPVTQSTHHRSSSSLSSIQLSKSLKKQSNVVKQGVVVYLFLLSVLFYLIFSGETYIPATSYEHKFFSSSNALAHSAVDDIAMPCHNHDESHIDKTIIELSPFSDPKKINVISTTTIEDKQVQVKSTDSSSDSESKSYNVKTQKLLIDEDGDGLGESYYLIEQYMLL
ncbi:uncharacterized protein ASCRUDRAFT_74158, partial [Ascoidea rubescens DSM 1968]